VRSECNGGKYSLGLKNVVFEIKSIVHPGNNEYTWKSDLFGFRCKLLKQWKCVVTC